MNLYLCITVQNDCLVYFEVSDSLKGYNVAHKEEHNLHKLIVINWSVKVESNFFEAVSPLLKSGLIGWWA